MSVRPSQILGGLLALSGTDLVLSGNVGKGNAAFDLDDSGVGNAVDMTNVFGTVAP